MPGVFFDLLSKFQILVVLQCEEKNGNEKKRNFLWRNIQISLSLSLSQFLVAFSDGKYLQQWWKHREQRKRPVS
jgi:hypothetical protein